MAPTRAVAAASGEISEEEFRKMKKIIAEKTKKIEALQNEIANHRKLVDTRSKEIESASIKVERTKKNFDAAKQPWTDQVEEIVRGLIPNRWSNIERVLSRFLLARMRQIAGNYRAIDNAPMEAITRMALVGPQEQMDARRALQLGIVSEVVAPDRLRP